MVGVNVLCFFGLSLRRRREMGGVVAQGNVFGGQSKNPRLKKGGECQFLVLLPIAIVTVIAVMATVCTMVMVTLVVGSTLMHTTSSKSCPLS
jgi:hypothetical protein